MKIVFIVLLFFTIGGTLSAQHPDDYRWDDRFGLAGITLLYDDSKINDCVSTTDYVVFGGRFSAPSHNLSFWNKMSRKWESIGNRDWSNAGVNAVVDGLYAVGDTLFVWGQFDKICGFEAKNFAILNLKSMTWSNDTTFDGRITEIRKTAMGTVVRGHFTIKNNAIQDLAYFDKGVWRNYDINTVERILSIPVEFKAERYSRIVDNNGTDLHDAKLAVYKNGKWSFLIDSLVSNDTYLNAEIITSKDYALVYGNMEYYRPTGDSIQKCNGFVLFDGTKWQNIVSAITYKGKRGISSAVFEGDNIYVAGDFSSINNIELSRIAKYSIKEKRWSALGSGIEYPLLGYTEIRKIILSENKLYVIGRFYEAGSQIVNNVGVFDLSEKKWTSLHDDKTNGIVNLLFGEVGVFADRGNIVAVGDFNYAGTERVNKIGEWDGRKWSNIGSGFMNDLYNKLDGRQRSLMAKRGIGQYLRHKSTRYLGGLFETLGGIDCEGIVSYDEGIVKCLGGGVSNNFFAPIGNMFFPSYVTDLELIKDKLYVTGNFKNTDTVKANGVAMWDGKNWEGLDGGISQPSNIVYTRLAADSSGNLLICGFFREIGGVKCNGLALWNGKKWEAIADNNIEASAFIRDVCVSRNGDMYVVGRIPDKYGKLMNGIASVKDNSFEMIGLLPHGSMTCNRIAVKGDMVYVAGIFDSIDNIQCSNVAVYNVQTKIWSSLGSGIRRIYYTDTVSTQEFNISTIAFVDDTVYFGGQFTNAGENQSFNIAAWHPPKISSTKNYEFDEEAAPLLFSPNPAQDIVTIHLKESTENIFSVVIYDLLGVKMFDKSYSNEKSENLHIDTSEWIPGTYILKFISNENKHKHKHLSYLFVKK